MFLGSSVFFRATGTVPYRIRSNIASGHSGLRRRSKPALLNAQALVKEKAEEEVGYSVTVKALPGSGSRNYLDSRERSEARKRERETRVTGALGDRARSDVALGHRANRVLLPLTSQVTPIDRPCPKANQGSSEHHYSTHCPVRPLWPSETCPVVATVVAVRLLPIGGRWYVA